MTVRFYRRCIGALILLVLTGFYAVTLAAELAVANPSNPSASVQSAKRGDILYSEAFDGTNTLKHWIGPAKLAPGFAQGKSLAIESSESQKSAVASCRVPLEACRGCTVRGTAMIRAENVSPKPNSWNGIKFMLVLQGPDGTSYPQAPLETGSFEWRRAAFSTRIPPDVTNASLVLGLENVTGKAWFDDVKVTVSKTPLTQVSDAVRGPMFKGHVLPRLRGTMISPGIDADSLRVLGRAWNANLIRWQLIRTGEASRDSSLENFDRWLDRELKKLDAALPLCEQDGLMVVIDLHSPPGGRPTAGGYVGSDSGLFTDNRVQQKFVDTWSRIAARYKHAKAIWGYDLANEPVEDDIEEGCDDWQALAQRAAVAIRAIDPQRAIIVEPARWGSPDGLNDLVPLSVSNVVYSVHMYIPHAFTHQGVFEQGPSYSYPGVIQGKLWNKAELERALQPAIDFQKRYNVHLYIGEFSAIRWAPDNSACRYLSDLIEIFEKQDWDWSYHAFREWQGWSVEHGPDKSDTKPASQPTDRQRLLQRWFSQNQKPGF